MERSRNVTGDHEKQDQRISIRVLLTKMVSKLSDHILNLLVTFSVKFLEIGVL